MKMAKIAELAGVSVSTVSKAFSGSREISEEKRTLIFNIAKENGCFDKYCKNTYDKPVIAVICPEFQSIHYSKQLSHLEREIKKYGGTMVASSTDFDGNGEKELLRFYAEYVKVDGIIIYSSRSKERYSIPVVSLGESDVYSSVVLSFEEAIYEAVKCFKDNGHSLIAFIGETHTTKKQSYFEKAMKKYNMEIIKDYVVKAESAKRFEEAGYIAMNKLLSMEKPPTAVLTAYDEIAVGAMRSITKKGLKVTEDISLIGMNDINEVKYLNPPLTTISSYDLDFCQIAVDLMFELLKNKGAKKKIKVQAKLIKRSSVGKCK